MFLARSDTGDKLTSILKSILLETKVASGRRTVFGSIKISTRRIFHKMMGFALFPRAVVGVFVLVAIFSFLRSFFVLGSTRGFAQWGELTSSAMVGIFVLIGIYKFTKNRLVAYEMFKIAIMVSIFLTQFFEFLTEQLAALFGLVVGIFILTVIEYMIREEKVLDAN